MRTGLATGQQFVTDKEVILLQQSIPEFLEGDEIIMKDLSDLEERTAG